jgi:hypothetical protein
MSKPDLSELIRTHPIKDIMEEWFFKIDEVTNGYSLVEGMNIKGNVVSRMGPNPDELVIACKNDIEQIMK